MIYIICLGKVYEPTDLKYSSATPSFIILEITEVLFLRCFELSKIVIHNLFNPLLKLVNAEISFPF